MNTLPCPACEVLPEVHEPCSERPSYLICCGNGRCYNDKAAQGVEELTEQVAIESWNSLVETVINEMLLEKEKQELRNVEGPQFGEKNV